MRGVRSLGREGRRDGPGPTGARRGPASAMSASFRAVATVGVGVLSACFPGPGAAPDAGPASGPPAIRIDGEMGDWDRVPVLQEDLADPEGAPRVDLDALWAADDPAWLYLALEVGEPLNLQAMPGTTRLLLDTDGDPATGATVLGVTGVELEVRMSFRPEEGGREYGAGFAVFVHGPAGPGDAGTRDPAAEAVAGAAAGPLRRLNPYDVAVTALPTHSAERFELRLARRLPAELGGGLLDGRIRMGVVAESSPPDTGGGAAAGNGDRGDGDAGDEPLRDDLATVPYDFRTSPGPDPFRPTLEPLARPADPEVFRVATWNVGEGSFRTPEDHARILAALGPDVILLDEVYGEVDDEALAAFFAWPGLAALGEWRWAVSRGGGRQKTVVAARDRGLRQVPEMVEVRYAPGTLEALGGAFPAPFDRMLTVEGQVQMSATGAWVEVLPGREVLFVPVDLQSMGWDGSPHDVLRLLQAQTILRHVRRASAGVEGGAAVVIAGDLNLVGSRAPLDALRAGVPRGIGPLDDARLTRLDAATPVTWRNRPQALFGPGRLDFTLFTERRLEQVSGFVFATDGLTEAQLDSLGLDREVSARTSDHLVMVADLRLKQP